MKLFALIAALTAPLPALADGYVLGSGRWTCADVLRIQSSGSGIEIGQQIGWVLGFVSAATFEQNNRFVDIVENAGGEKIYNATLAECQKAAPETLLYRVVQKMIDNTQ